VFIIEKTDNFITFVFIYVYIFLRNNKKEGFHYGWWWVLFGRFGPKRLSLLRSGAGRNVLGRLLSGLDGLLLSGDLGLSTLLPASNIRVNPEHDKQVGQRCKVADVKGKSKQLTRSVQASAVLT
jgi:hypothetical protein